MSTLSPKLSHEEKQRKKMLLSSRANPPKPLKVGGSDRYLSIKHLLPRTPIPSPSLPSILPRHGKKPPKLNSRRIVRGLVWLSFLISAYYLVSFGRRSTPSLTELTFLTSLGKTYEIVEASELPEHPTPLALTDSKGKHHWTISIPQSLVFPLPSAEYADICSQVDDVARHVAGIRQHTGTNPTSEDYYREDPNFIDVQEAQARNFLPREKHPTPGRDDAEDDLPPVCAKSLTYVLDAADAGFGSALLGMWLSYGLAKREGRAFFVDDTHFPYGNYSTFFASTSKTTPSPPCRPPPPSQRVPCPHQARHLVVSAATTSWVFGESFHGHFSQRQIFDMAREGYETLWELQTEDREYARNRAAKLRGTAAVTSSDIDAADTSTDGLVGIHIRRGDRHPFSLAYSQNYLPVEHYMATARRLVGKSERWKFLVASDDADMYDHVELPAAMRAQERISLASKKQMSGGGLGWEGGFFKDVFWGLGLPEHVKALKRAGSPMPTKARERFGEKDADGRERRVHHHPPSGLPVSAAVATDLARDYRTDPTRDALHLRQLLGRAYLLDLAMLAHSDRVVCGVSSNACRVLAVMMGWERAFNRGHWINVDGSYAWRVLDY